MPSPDAPTRIRIGTANPYDVVIGAGLHAELVPMLGAGVRKVGVIHPRALRATAEALRTTLTDAGLEAHAIEVPDGEEAKTYEVAAFCWSVLGRCAFTRTDVVIGLGGGSTTDLAGFVGATWLRGVRTVLVPTTLLGMVDAAVGGKTGINIDEGKNLVGAFHEPSGVLCDLGALTTLPRNELISGLAEVIKCGFIVDPVIVDLVESASVESLTPTDPLLRELVERSVRVKADVVAADLTESASAHGELGREVLNYGHTLGHAIERVEKYRYRHGAAVAIGMLFVAELARLAGRLDDSTVDRHRRVLELVGLPTSYRSDAWPALYDAMRVDKKARGDRLRFVILDGMAKPGILESPDAGLLAAAYSEISR